MLRFTRCKRSNVPALADQVASNCPRDKRKIRERKEARAVESMPTTAIFLKINSLV